MSNSDKPTIAGHQISSQILASIVASLFIFPFFWFQRSLPLPSVYGESAAIVLGLISLFIWLLQQRDKVLIPSLTLLPIILALLIGAQLSVMPDLFASHARVGMAYLLVSAALMTAIFNAKPLININTLAAALLIGTLANCAHDWYRIIFENAERLDALGQKNNYADYVMLGVISLCYLYAKKHFGIMAFFLLLIPLIITSAGLSQRSTWIYFIGLTGFTLTKTYKVTHQNTRLRHSVLFAAALFVFANTAMPLISNSQSSLERLMNSGEAELGASSRLWIWKSAWQMILVHPWLGVGFGNFDWTYFTTKTENAAGAYWGWIEHAHNIILHLFAELGLLAPLALLLSLAFWLKAQRSQPFDDQNWWIWSCIGVIGIHSLLEYPLWYAFFLAPTAVLFGLTSQSFVAVRLPRSLSIIGCLMIATAVSVSANFLSNYSRLESFIAHLKTNPLSVDPAELDTIARQEPMLRPYVWQIKAASTRITANNAADWLPYLEQINRVALHPNFVLKQIVALQLTGNQPEAIELAKTLAHTFPERSAEYLSNPDIRSDLGPNVAAAMQAPMQSH